MTDPLGRTSEEVFFYTPAGAREGLLGVLLPAVLLSINLRFSGTNMTGQPGDRTTEIIMEEVPRRTSRAPLRPFVFACFNRSGSTGTFRFPGATWDRFRCTVAPSPSQIQCRVLSCL